MSSNFNSRDLRLEGVRGSLSIALLKAREALMVHFRPILAEHDITEQQWRVIRVLAEADELEASEVAQRAFILAPSLTRMIRSLEDRKFVRRSKDLNDARRVILKITDEGLDVIAAVAPQSKLVYERLNDQVGKEKVRQLLDLLDDLAAFV